MRRYVLQRFQIGNRNMLVYLVDRSVRRSELDHLRAERRNEAAIRCATGRREVGLATGNFDDRARNRIGQISRRRQEGLRADSPLHRELETMLAQNTSIRCISDSALDTDAKRRLKSISQVPGTTFSAPVPRAHSKPGTSSAEKIRCRHPSAPRQLRQRWRHLVHRIAHQLRIRHMALDADDGQPTGQRSAAAILDRVAERVD